MPRTQHTLIEGLQRMCVSSVYESLAEFETIRLPLRGIKPPHAGEPGEKLIRMVEAR